MVGGQRWWSRWGFQREHDQQFYKNSMQAKYLLMHVHNYDTDLS